MADDTLKEALDLFRECEENESDNRADFLDDTRFSRLGEQWPETVRKQRELEGRPCLTINKMPAFIRQVVNDARQNRPAITVHPADDTGDKETAKIMSGLIRNIEVTSSADIAYDTAIDNAVTGGFGYWRINLDYACDDTFEKDILIKRVANPLAVFGDPYSQEADSSDWMNAFVVEHMTKRAFEKKYKGADAIDWSSEAWRGVNVSWLNGETVQVAEWWQREEITKQVIGLTDGTIVDVKLFEEMAEQYAAEGIQPNTQPRPVKSYKVTQRVMNGAEVIDKVDWVGRYIPIIPVYGDEVIVEGKRYFRSLIRDAKDPARMHNYWRTTSTELVGLAPRTPFIGQKGAFKTDAAKWASANNSSHAYIEYDGNTPPQRQPFAGPPSGMIQEAMSAADDMKAVMGIYDASLGARSNETSGKAIMARQREGDVSTFHFIDNLSRAIRHSGKILIDLIPQIYTADRIVRVLGEDSTPDIARIAGQGQPHNPQAGIYDIAAGKYDLTVTTGPSFTTRREEAATQMMELIRSYPDAAPIIGDLLVKNLDWQGAEEIAERLKAMLPPQVKGENPEAQAMKQQLEQDMAAFKGLEAQMEQVKADKTLEARKVDIDAYNAETNRLKAMGAAMQPEQVQALVLQTIQQLLQSPDVLPMAGEMGPVEDQGGMMPPEMPEQPEGFPAQ